MFIWKYAKETLPLTELPKKSDKAGEPPNGKPQCQKSENHGKVKWEWTQQAKLAFREVKRTSTEAPILRHFNPAKPIILQMDMSGFAITGILNQYDAFGVLRPLNFYSRKSSLAEWNYDTDDPELLAIVESQKQW